MGRIKLTSERKPSVWDRRKRHQQRVADQSLYGRFEPPKATTEDNPPGLPDNCTWVGVFGVNGDPTCRTTGDLFELEVRQRGAPFVIWEQDKTDWQPGDIPVVVLYATTDDAILTLAENFGRFDKDGKAVFPFQCVRDTRNGEAVGFAGPAKAADVAMMLDLAREMRDRAVATAAVSEIAETAKPAND